MFDKITNEIPCLETSEIVKLFSNLEESDISRNSENIDLLIGHDYAVLASHRRTTEWPVISA